MNENFFTQVDEELNYWRTKSSAEVTFINESSELNAHEIKTIPKTSRSMRSFPKKILSRKHDSHEPGKNGEEQDKTYIPLIFSQQAAEIR